MIKLKVITSLSLLLTSYFLSTSLTKQNSYNLEGKKSMKLNSGVITEKLSESKLFYQNILGFGVTFENEFYVLMHTPDRRFEISFLKPNHPSQQPLFQKPFIGNGVYLTLEVEDVDDMYEQMKAKKVNIVIDIRDEPWGDRHFAIQDPNGVGIDIVTYSKPE